MVGHNGAGKSTLLKSLFGLATIHSGRIVLDGMLVAKPTPLNSLKAGIVYLPQRKQVFPELSIKENLALVAQRLPKHDRSDRMNHVATIFPVLRQRWNQEAGSLSGGERQMLGLGLAMIMSPRLLLLDEPSLGLAPDLVVRVLEKARDLAQGYGVAVVVVEHKVKKVLAIADCAYVLRNGRVTFGSRASDLMDEATLLTAYL